MKNIKIWKAETKQKKSTVLKLIPKFIIWQRALVEIKRIFSWL